MAVLFIRALVPRRGAAQGAKCERRENLLTDLLAGGPHWENHQWGRKIQKTYCVLDGKIGRRSFQRVPLSMGLLPPTSPKIHFWQTAVWQRDLLWKMCAPRKKSPWGQKDRRNFPHWQRGSKQTGFSRADFLRPGRPGTKISFFEKWSKPGSEGVVGTRGPPTVPTTPVFLGLLPFAQKLVLPLFGAPWNSANFCLFFSTQAL